MVVVAVFVFVGISTVCFGLRLGQFISRRVGEITAGACCIDCGKVALGIIGIGAARLLTEGDVVESRAHGGASVQIAVVCQNYGDGAQGFALVFLFRRNHAGGILPQGIVVVKGHIEVFFCSIGVIAAGNQAEISFGVVFGGGIGQRRLIIRRSIGRAPTGEQIGIGSGLVDGNGLAGALHAVGIAPEIANIIAFVARFIIKM